MLPVKLCCIWSILEPELPNATSEALLRMKYSWTGATSVTSEALHHMKYSWTGPTNATTKVLLHTKCSKLELPILPVKLCCIWSILEHDCITWCWMSGQPWRLDQGNTSPVSRKGIPDCIEPALGSTEGTFDSSRFSAEGTLISASLVPHHKENKTGEACLAQQLCHNQLTFITFQDRCQSFLSSSSFLFLPTAIFKKS